MYVCINYTNVQKGRIFMFSTFNTLMVIVVLEAICCLYSVTLAYLSDKKFSKVLNLIMAAIWAIAAVLNVVGFQAQSNLSLFLGKVMLEIILSKIQNNPISYEGYLEYAKYLENVNLKQAYLTYENALFYCQDELIQIEIQKKLDEIAYRQGKVEPASIVILS